MNQEELLKLIDQAAEDGREELELSGQGLTELPKEIGKLKNLTKLYLVDNQISEIPDAIAELKNLTVLYLGNNKISEIPDVIAELTDLTELYLSYNQISKIPDTITELKNLTKLYLVDNQISEIPLVSRIFRAGSKTKNRPLLHKGFRKPQSVARINKDTNEIPDAISGLKNLNILLLHNNPISKIPDAISELKNLTGLSLGNNKISEIPDVIAELTDLTELYLSNNQISKIPDTIAELKNLTGLYLGSNKISKIPDAILELKKLKTLDLSYNQISEIPETIIQLENLERDEYGMGEGINIQGNPIINPPYEIAEKGIDAIRIYFLNQQLSRYKDVDTLKIERSIEFPPEYWTAGTSILSYFSHILGVKYPDQNIKVRIEQESLLLRMIIDTPEGQTETIEKTFNDYLMVISRQLPPESLLTDPFEVMALKNKLEIAELELRQNKELFAIVSDKDRQRINSLEMQVSELFSLIGQSFQKDHHTTVNINQELSNQHGQGDNIGNDKIGNDKVGNDKIE